jgi:hydrogenase nickel incorporation protein HypB
VLVINKIDLLPYVNARVETIEQYAREINPDLTIFRTSCTTGDGIAAWCDWLRQRVAAARA